MAGYWKFDCSYINEVTMLEGVPNGTSFSLTQYCEYNNCTASDYISECFEDLDGNIDCNSCSPAEGCSDEFKDLMLKMFAYNPNDRPTISELKSHPWMN